MFFLILMLKISDFAACFTWFRRRGLHKDTKEMQRSHPNTGWKGKAGKVIIIDIVINEEKDEHELTEAKLFFDMLMMVMVTGRERTEEGWEKLFMAAGFSDYKITPLFGLRSLIEVYP